MQVEKDLLGLIFIILIMHLAKFRTGLITTGRSVCQQRSPARCAICLLVTLFGQNSNLSSLTHLYQDKSVTSLFKTIMLQQISLLVSAVCGEPTFSSLVCTGGVEVVFRVGFGLGGWHRGLGGPCLSLAAAFTN